MARPELSHPDNVPGDWYADTRCIECDVARHYAPELIGSVAGKSVVLRQPIGDDEELAVWRAALACPTQSIGTHDRRRPPDGVFPWELGDGVHLCGYNSPASFGAHSYLAVRPAGNLLVDSPRYTRRLVDPIRQLGGISHVLLSHRDDVADAERWAEEFGARVWIHEAERSAAPFATDLLVGKRTLEPVCHGVVALTTPGHTRGSVCYLVDDHLLFSGDTLHWNHRRRRLDVFGRATWYSWDELRRSMAWLGEAATFDRVLAGHGSWGHAPAATFAAELERLVDEMGRWSAREWSTRP